MSETTVLERVETLPVQAEVGQSPFDAISRRRPDGSEFWSGREMMPYLGYSKWERMADAIERAKQACLNSGHDPEEHFPGAGKYSEVQRRPGVDVHLSRFGCYLVAMNGDPRKAEVAAAQRYFAVRTREAELAATPSAVAPPTTHGDELLTTLKALVTFREEQLAMQAGLAGLQAGQLQIAHQVEEVKAEAEARVAEAQATADEAKARAVRAEAEVLEQRAKLARAEADAARAMRTVTGETDWFCLVTWAETQGVSIPSNRESAEGKAATAICKARGIAPGKLRTTRYPGGVNTYPEDVLREWLDDYRRRHPVA